MKQWIGYYENILSDEVSNSIMSIKDGWKASVFSSHSKTQKESSNRVIMDEINIRGHMTYYKDLLNGTKEVVNLYQKKHPYMKYFLPQFCSDFRVNRYSKGGFMSEHTDNIHHSHKQRYGFPHGSILFFLNDDYEGGEFIVADNIYKPKKNSSIIFPSNFMFPHSVNKIEEGTRYSIITWLMQQEITLYFQR